MKKIIPVTRICLNIIFMTSFCFGMNNQLTQDIKNSWDNREKVEKLIVTFTENKKLEKCTICIQYLDPQDNNKKSIKLRCNHEFHDDCLQSWTKTGASTCPLCRASIADEKKFIEALECNNLELFKASLIKYPFLANMFVEPKTKTRILHRAAEQGKLDFVKLLLAYNAYVNARNTNKETPLFLAVRFGHVYSALYLIKKGAWITTCDYNDFTPIHEAAANGWSSLIKKLIHKHAFIEARTLEEGYTPLMLAIKNKKYWTVITLLENGANPAAVDKKNKSVLEHAKESGYYALEKIVRRYL